MTSWLVRFSFAALLGCLLSGCFPPGQSQLEEEKEPHFLLGKTRVNAMDYKGAIEAFEKALETNPQSASAHFELGLLYEKNEMDYAAAIFHFERFLKLRPNSDYGEIVKQRLLGCKQELARAVLPLPTTPAMQREFEQLAEENKRLREEVEKWRAAYANRAAAATNSPAPAQLTSRSAQNGSQTAPGTTPQISAVSNQQPAANAAAVSRTHTVKAGESPYSIARKYGVKLDALMAANPRIDPRRIQVGQALNIPPP
jgi:tetratricopeptide (TPR) repeat protein